MCEQQEYVIFRMSPSDIHERKIEITSYTFMFYLFNSLGLSHSIWCHKTCSTLLSILACCQTVRTNTWTSIKLTYINEILSVAFRFQLQCITPCLIYFLINHTHMCRIIRNACYRFRIRDAITNRSECKCMPLIFLGMRQLCIDNQAEDNGWFMLIKKQSLSRIPCIVFIQSQPLGNGSHFQLISSRIWQRYDMQTFSA